MSCRSEKDGIETVRERLVIESAAVIFTMIGKEGAEEQNEVTRMLGRGGDSESRCG